MDSRSRKRWNWRHCPANCARGTGCVFGSSGRGARKAKEAECTGSNLPAVEQGGSSPFFRTGLELPTYHIWRPNTSNDLEGSWDRYRTEVRPKRINVTGRRRQCCNKTRRLMTATSAVATSHGSCFFQRRSIRQTQHSGMVSRTWRQRTLNAVPASVSRCTDGKLTVGTQNADSHRTTRKTHGPNSSESRRVSREWTCILAMIWTLHNRSV